MNARYSAIQASTDEPITHNTYLILDKPYPNFEIRLKYRFITRTGNSGLQFRSGIESGLLNPDRHELQSTSI